ncbi:hypothetical protein BDU57DRAFT_132197 [Ampelomyces quisqualis]|uniref:Uncharacterized protein n=1 Tax=Ampelomyces quisqualis TaxID=50730 RepID=A0A6A5QTY6_AMPQU|nr:hypothetical protein BDU57DRAFT_132197 [Ampelomyces quisqualis]
MQVGPAECLLAGAMVSDGVLEAVVRGAIDGERGGVAKVGLASGVQGKQICAGSVVGVWGDGAEVGGRMLVDVLFDFPDGLAAVVDSSGNFDVLGVYKELLERLKRDGVEKGDGVEHAAAKMLDRVRIMRVFDFVGVREAIGEIRDELEGRMVVEPEQKSISTPKLSTSEPFKPEQELKRTVVADSEDEDDDEEMLLDATEALSEETPAVRNVSPPQTTPTKTPPPQQNPSCNKLKFVLIDNLTQVLTPLLKKDSIQGTSPFSFALLCLECTDEYTANDLSSTFMHSLAHLTRTHALFTILSNPAPSPRQQPGPLHHHHQQQQARQAPPPPPSIFASNDALPSLVGVLGRYVDVSVLVSHVPKRKIDARVWYREGHGGGLGKKIRGVEMSGVVEVMGDRWGDGAGRWGIL